MRFKSTQNIFVDLGEVFDENWMNSNTVILPPNPKWDYSRELRVEDVDIWEVICEQGGAVGVYAAWCPYAEFYLIRVGFDAESKGHGFETYYGQGAQKLVQKRIKELGLYVESNSLWVDDEDMWLYSQESKSNTLILP